VWFFSYFPYFVKVEQASIICQWKILSINKENFVANNFFIDNKKVIIYSLKCYIF